ncbi:hypothetical protein GOARA_056_00220 [Gordonia araii NBRC 100433]|uniref:Transmembrane protein n=1 Tax=Gordonia araii NBRC 100433 TaxID=1073574 RepID=G7H350_9ACTN|nr:hypothetical protein [Gordonia araii]NNG96394.1 hypothetical protein [Gordonia araii NBRC 100433]GAB10275.1 hypothetical protein GOARA_056_00220 [Gordonia araii NBRC 100433]
MWTKSASVVGLLAAIFGFLLFAGGTIYGYVALTQLSEQRSVTTTCKVDPTSTGVQICETEAGGRPDRLVEAKQSRVILATGLMVSGAVLLGAGLVSGRQQYRYAPVPGAPQPVGAR